MVVDFFRSLPIQRCRQCAAADMRALMEAGKFSRTHIPRRVAFE